MTTTTYLSNLQVPLAEHFHSVQGEGLYTGLPMHFLRFPGCSVGRSQTIEDIPGGDVFQVLPNNAIAKICTAFNGQEFFCDTDYEKHEESTVESLLAETFETTLCFTGGEPLIHQTKAWFKSLLHGAAQEIHVETSGTILPLFEPDWLTVSPKQNWRKEVIARADQIKFLITPNVSIAELEAIAECRNDGCLIYLSPIFDPNDLVPANLERCFEIQRSHPEWRVGCQWHKFLGLR